jgi:transcriptional regulator with XRE-family HTH domain
MKGSDLRSARRTGGMTQAAAAAMLGVSQAYLSMVERGRRAVSPELAARVAKSLPVPPVALPLGRYRRQARSERWFKEQLGGLGYPGFAYLRAEALTNPALVLLDALDTEDLDPRVVEGLPWIPVAFPDLDWDWLIANAKANDRQNRLGFVVELARQVASLNGDDRIARLLSSPASALDRSRLAREDTLCYGSMTQAEHRWLRECRTADAAHWNLLSKLTSDQLDHALHHTTL